MSTGIKLSVLESLISKPEPETPDWRLLCDVLRLDPAFHPAGSRIIGILRALSRSLAAGLWDEKRPKVSLPFPAAIFATGHCPIIPVSHKQRSSARFQPRVLNPLIFHPLGGPPPGRNPG
jgi:hypothetical protein